MEAELVDNLPPTLFSGYFDQNNPLSLWQKLGKHWAEKFLNVLNSMPEAATMLHDETMLKRWLQEHKAYRPTPTDNRYRYQFWLEYDNSVQQHRQMNMKNVYGFIGADATFHKLICRDACRMTWLICRPAGYEAAAREMLTASYDRLRTALEKDAFENPSKPNMKLLEIQLKIHQMFDLRLHGAPTQKIQQLNVNAAIGANGELKEILDKGDMQGLRDKLEDLRVRKRKAEGRGAEAAQPAPIVDAELVTVEAKDGNDSHISKPS